jgi:hypothetical protein
MTRLESALRALLAQPDPVATENLIDAPFGSRFQIGSPLGVLGRVHGADDCRVTCQKPRFEESGRAIAGASLSRELGQ